MLPESGASEPKNPRAPPRPDILDGTEQTEVGQRKKSKRSTAPPRARQIDCQGILGREAVVNARIDDGNRNESGPGVNPCFRASGPFHWCGDPAGRDRAFQLKTAACQTGTFDLPVCSLSRAFWVESTV